MKEEGNRQLYYPLLEDCEALMWFSWVVGYVSPGIFVELGKNYYYWTGCWRGIFGNSIYTSEHSSLRKINSRKQIMMKGFWAGWKLTLSKESFKHGLFNQLRGGLVGQMQYSVWEGGWDQRPTVAPEENLVLWLMSCHCFHLSPRTRIQPVNEIAGPQQC